MKERITHIYDRIAKIADRCGRDPSSIRLVAVSKTKPAEKVKAAFEAGASVFGENYIQEAREKFNALSSLNISWHFIGHLQSNKAKYAVKLFDLIHSVDSLKLAMELDKQAGKIAKVQDILVQVNVSNETTKSGSSAETTESLIKDIAPLSNIRILGLMTMPPYFNSPERARPYFSVLRKLRDNIRQENIPNVSMEELSMGMTGDYEVAIEEGATLVRIGTAIFGSRH